MGKLSLQSLPETENFLGLPEAYTAFPDSKVVIWPLGYERTTTYGKGTAAGPRAILDASRNVELYDEVQGWEPYHVGITTLAVKTQFAATEPAAMDEIEAGALQILDEKKFLISLGGEHSISIPLVRAFSQRFSDLSVLQLDAHADLRKSYLGSTLNHACALAGIRQYCPSVGVGIRSLSVEEAQDIQAEQIPIVYAHELHGSTDWQRTALAQLNSKVYLTIDLDFFDPSIMPAVGTPEPGGATWYEALSFLTRLFQEKKVVGLDVVELCPRTHEISSAFTAAKLIYRLIGLAFPRA
ncbi:agmatinase [candidate division KSB1 bacterium]|nr:agmatinase [candidate division KSB1 bacterium]